MLCLYFSHVGKSRFCVVLQSTQIIKVKKNRNRDFFRLILTTKYIHYCMKCSVMYIIYVYSMNTRIGTIVLFYRFDDNV